MVLSTQNMFTPTTGKINTHLSDIETMTVTIAHCSPNTLVIISQKKLVDSHPTENNVSYNESNLKIRVYLIEPT